jgi:FdrA protein
MIDPELRNELLAKTLADPGVAVVLLDVVIGYGAHADPAGLVAQVVEAAKARGGAMPAVVASVTGTDGDPQGYSRQVARLAAAGVQVDASNAGAARLAARVVA